MDVFIYQEQKNGSLKEIAEMEDATSVDMALDALIDAEPKFEGEEFVVFVGQRLVVEAGEIVQPRRAFTIKSSVGSPVESDEDVTEEPEEEDDEPVVVAPKPKRKPAAKRKPASKPKPKAKAKPRAKTTTKVATEAEVEETPKVASPKPGTRTGAKASGKKSPFTVNPDSAE